MTEEFFSSFSNDNVLPASILSIWFTGYKSHVFQLIDMAQNSRLVPLQHYRKFRLIYLILRIDHIKQIVLLQIDWNVFLFKTGSSFPSQNFDSITK